MIQNSNSLINTFSSSQDFGLLSRSKVTETASTFEAQFSSFPTHVCLLIRKKASPLSLKRINELVIKQLLFSIFSILSHLFLHSVSSPPVKIILIETKEKELKQNNSVSKMMKKMKKEEGSRQDQKRKDGQGSHQRVSDRSRRKKPHRH